MDNRKDNVQPLYRNTCAPESNKNMVTVDHDLSGGVISSLYPENGDVVEGTTPSSTKENPYKMTCEEVDNQEVYPKKLPSTILLEMTPTDSSDLPSVNKEGLLTSIVNHFLPREEGAKTTEPEPETVVQGWLSQSHKISSIPEEECSDNDDDDIPWYDRRSSSETPPSHEPKQVVTVQGWFSQPDETSENQEEHFPEDHEAEDTTLPESEEESSKSTYEMCHATQEA